MDLADPDQREATVRRLAGPVAGRPVVCGPIVLAATTGTVRWLRDLGCDVLVVSTMRGAGPVPGPDECRVVEVAPPATSTVTEEMRTLDRLARDLPPEAVAAIEELDPGRRGVWWCGPFVTSDEPVLGRPVVGGRPRAFLDLEDKLLAEQVWTAAGVTAAPHRIVPVDADALAAAAHELGTDLGTVWAGDARDGFNGGGNYVRWVRDGDDREAARAFFLPRCDRVRVMPFLDGVPCSIHGFVMPDGTAVLRPVEIAMLRDVAGRRFVYGGLGTTWDPPAADREAMRSAARRVGEQLRAAYGYRGAFGIDGVLTADGFRPTELNPRLSAGTTALGLDGRLLPLLQANLLAGIDPGLSVADVETLVAVADAARTGRPVAVGQGVSLGGREEEFWVSHVDGRLERSAEPTGNRVALADTRTGFFARIEPCAALRPGDRLATLNVALMDFLDREYDAGFGPLTPAPDLQG